MIGNKVLARNIGLVVATSILSVQSQAIAVNFKGTFDWVTTNQTTPSSGNANFMFEKDPFQEGMIIFNVETGIGAGSSISGVVLEAFFGNNWSLEALDFITDSGNLGAIDFMGTSGEGGYENAGSPGGILTFDVTNLETEKVPEPGSSLGLLTLGILGTVSALKCKMK